MRFVVLGFGLLAIGVAIALAVAPDSAPQPLSQQAPAFASAGSFSDRILTKPGAAAIPPPHTVVASQASSDGAAEQARTSDAKRAGGGSIWAEPARFAPPGT